MRESTRRSIIVALLVLPAVAACDDDVSTADTSDAADTAVAPDTDAAGPDGDDVEADTSDVTEVIDPPDLSVRPGAGEVRAGITTKASDLIGGPKAEARVGAIKLWNERAAFIIEAPGRTGGYREQGGNVIDIDLAAGGEDRFGELWFAWNLEIFHAETVEIVSDGRDGLAVVRFTGRTGRYIWLAGFLRDIVNPPHVDLAVTFEYRLAPDDDVLDLVVTLTNDTEEQADVSLPLTAMNMGDGVRPFGIGGGLGGVTGNSQPWLGMIGLYRSYGFIGEGKLLNGLFNYQNVQLLQAEPFLLAPGQSAIQRFGFVVGDEGTTTVAAAAAERFEVGPVVEVTGTVTGEVGWADDEPAPSNTNGRSWVAAVRGEDVHGVVPVDAQGRFRLLLAPGEYDLRAYAPQRGGSEATAITVDDDPITGLTLALPALGEVVVTVTSGGAPLPVEISFFRGPGAPRPVAPEEAGFDVDWRHGRSSVVFSTDGLGRAHLLPGSYTVTASRGYSYTFAEAEVTVAPGTSQSLQLTIDKVVEDSGWVAADLHLHSIWSADSDTPYIARLRQAAAQDITLPMFTEHAYLGHAHLELDDSGVGDWVIPVPAQEVTTFEYGHFNAYPLEYRPDEPAFGAVYEHGHLGADLFDAIRAQHDGDHLIQLNHPRQEASISAFLTYVEFDRANATSDNPRWTTNWDVLEVFNGTCGPSTTNRETLLDWYAMNDHGLGKVLGSGSDSHSEAAGLGTPRNWIEIDKSLVEADVEALVAPLRARKTFVSCGPFVRFRTSDGKGMGELAAVDGSGVVTFEVEVVAPDWIGLASVALLENGVPIATVEAADFTPAAEAGDNVRHRGTFTATPSADAWYVIEVRGAGNLWPVEPGETPYALTNPIEVDADRDATWTPPAVSRTAPARPRAPAVPRDRPGLPDDGHDH
ncbi:MAG: CehA/McbA family metallohydrolase [Deltaproteobacteria bacterium]|nr:CehA/McbA family metallohydrolase [Deltaproteobacteria bacterium]